MKNFNLEKIVDRSIPYMLILLLVVIIIDFFFKEIAHKYHSFLVMADYIVIAVFVVDLVFKYLRVRKIPQFLKTYWLDIIAIFPFFLFFRILEETLILSEAVISRSQEVVHAGRVIGEEAEVVSKGSA